MACNQEEKRDVSKTEEDACYDYSLEEEISYHDEICSIMYAFGDVKNPLDNSVKLMHNILESQLAILIKNAKIIGKLREGSCRISHVDLLFLMRRNKVLLKRLLNFLSVEDSRAYLLQGLKNLGKRLYPEEEGDRVFHSLQCLAFIEKFKSDLTSVLQDKTIIDHVYLDRLKRRDLMTSFMTKEEYENFYEHTLRVSFCYKHNNEKFLKWLQLCSGIKFQASSFALLIIHFLARETVATIVEKALEIKSRKYRRSDTFPCQDFSNSVNLHEFVNEDNLHKRTKNFGFKVLKNSWDMHKLENNLQPSFSKSSGNNRKRKASTDSEENRITNKSHTDMQSMNNCSSTSLDTDDVEKRRKNCDICDDSESDHNFSDTNYVINEGTNSASFCKSRTDRFSNIQLHVPAESKTTTKNPYFSLNFKEKFLSIFCDDSTTFEIDMNPKRKKTCKVKKNDYIKAMENKGLTTSCFVEPIEESEFDESKQKHHKSKLLSSECFKHAGHPPFVMPIKNNLKIDWFPKEAISPREIQAAFIHYQRPLPMSYLMQTKLSHALPKKINLVCLANPEEFNQY